MASFLSAVILVSVFSLAVVATTDGVLTRRIEVARAQTFESQKMTVQYLLVAADVSAPENSLHLQASIISFSVAVAEITDEGPLLQAAPLLVPVLMPNLTTIQQTWTSIKEIFLGNLTSSDPLHEVETSSEVLLRTLDALVERLTSYLVAVGSATLPLASSRGEMVFRQRVRLQEMQKFVLLAHLGRSPPSQWQRLQRTMDLFEVSRLGLLRGVELVGLAGMSDVCSLHGMAKASQQWEQLAAMLEEPISSDFEEMSSQGRLLDQRLAAVVALVNNESAVLCDPVTDIGDAGWLNAMRELNRQRIFAHRAVSQFLTMMVNQALTASEKATLVGFISDASSSLRSCIEGSLNPLMPAAPTQHIVDHLFTAWREWQLLEQDMRRRVDEGDASPESWVRLSLLSRSTSDTVSRAAELYLEASFAAKPSLDTAPAYLANRQLALLEVAAEEAILASAGEASAVTALEAALRTFEETHWMILWGGSPGPNSSERISFALNTTTNTCLLRRMSDALQAYVVLRGEFRAMVNGTSAGLQRVHELLTAASGAMQLAADGLANGTALSCQPPDAAPIWIKGISASAQLPMLLSRSLGDYMLMASGLDAKWRADANAMLEMHQRFLYEDVRKPRLQDALVDFTQAWNSYAPTNAERTAGLQVAYIHENPHPAGRKDLLDRAPGSEEYHRVHNTYHPIYREMLYDRNYYDIFIFDLGGNLIYSVFKELDYATNFREGGGEWADSGLGSAFRAALQQPDVVSVIPWMPYGPSNGALASFISSGIWVQGKLAGVFCTQLPPDAKPPDSSADLQVSIAEIDGALTGLKFGDAAAGISAAPTQAIAYELFAANVRWSSLKHSLQGRVGLDMVSDLATQGAVFTSAMQRLIQTYISDAWAVNQSVQGTRIAVAKHQVTLLKQIQLETVLIYMKSASGSSASLRAMKDEFEGNHGLLLRGNRTEGQPLTVSDVQATTDPLLLRLMKDVDAAWLAWKPSLQIAAAAGAGLTEALAKTVVDQSEVVKDALDKTLPMFTATYKITITPVDILAPMPLTGQWSGGRTMRVAALLAQDIINAEQAILPGYKLNTVIFDDRCDPQLGTELMMEAISAPQSTYVALGGTGCSEVCSRLAFLASSLRLPFLSYECADKGLSDTLRYPSLLRFGTETSAATDVFAALAERYGWPGITVVSGNPSVYEAQAEELRDSLRTKGVASNYVFSLEGWQQVVQTMEGLKATRRRVFLVLGSETFFRKLICASIVVGMNKGITWLSQGTWRHEWWKKSDSIIESYRQWIKAHAIMPMLRTAVVAFEEAWRLLGSTDSSRRQILQAAYITNNPFPTGSKHELDAADGEERYHSVHALYHPHYRAMLRDLNYYDIFIFDLGGNLIYSVFKELDYATNFNDATSEPWGDSGLGEAFRLARANPDEVSEIPWRPYGPSHGALASFFSTGIRAEDGTLLGVLVTQLPSAAKSIDTQQPQCTLEAIADNFEGAINVVGYGRPHDTDLEKPLPCFRGHTAKSFLTLVERHLAEGYPLGDNRTQVPDPFFDIMAHAADATCALAYVIKHMLQIGYSIQDLKRPTQAVYDEFVSFSKTYLDFWGVSGKVRFVGNDKPGLLSVQQVIQGSAQVVGMISLNGTMDLSVGGGPRNESWRPAHPLPPVPDTGFPTWTIYLLIPALVCLPACWAVRKYYR